MPPAIPRCCFVWALPRSCFVWAVLLISRGAALSPARVGRAVVLDAFTADQGDRALWEPLNACADDVAVFDRTPASLCLERARGAQVLLTNKVRLDASAVAALAEDGLAFVGSVATGYDHIDVGACAAHGVVVSNVPKYSTNAVAQMVMAYLLHDASNVHAHAAAARDGTWAAADDFTTLSAAPLRGRSRASGSSSSAAARRRARGTLAAAFGMAVAYAKAPREAAGDEPERRAPTSARACRRARRRRRRRARVLLVAATRARGPSLLRRPRAARAARQRRTRADRRRARARGRALRRGARAATGLPDVLCDEPPRDPESASAALLGLGEAHAVVTPHVAWGTLEARRRLRSIACENARAFVQEGSRVRAMAHDGRSRRRPGPE